MCISRSLTEQAVVVAMSRFQLGGNGFESLWDTGYPNWDFAWFSSVPANKFCDNTSIWPERLPFKAYIVRTT